MTIYNNILTDLEGQMLLMHGDITLQEYLKNTYRLEYVPEPAFIYREGTMESDFSTNLAVQDSTLENNLIRRNIEYQSSQPYTGFDQYKGDLIFDLFLSIDDNINAVDIADLLDQYYKNKLLPNGTQTLTSLFRTRGYDPSDNRLARYRYLVPFLYSESRLPI